MAFANPYYQNQYQMPQYQARDWPMLKGRPVTSIDEVRAPQVDFDGSVSYFPDTAHNTIYTKQINLDGTASIHTYTLVEDKQEKAMSYVTHQEFAPVVSDIKGLMSDISELKSLINGVGKNDPVPNANQTNDRIPSF